MQDYISYVFGGINALLNQNAGLFESMGMNLFRGFALIVISWFGIQSALLSASGGGGFNWASFAGMFQEILVCFVMLSFYTAPIPGIGISFTHLILDQVQNMVGTLDQTSVQGLRPENLNGLERRICRHPLHSRSSKSRFVSWFLSSVSRRRRRSRWRSSCSRYVATAVIIGSSDWLFIPFKIVPQMEWMFWGWFRAFLHGIRSISWSRAPMYSFSGSF